MFRLIALSILFVLLIGLTGCLSNELVIKTTYPWEGHYMSIDEFMDKGVKQMCLNDDDSIWLISNDTLKLILTN